jgi:uncharacterized membrane protein YdjX (TVP38/TMEM64 family)
MINKKLKSIGVILLIIGLFILLSYIAQKNIAFFKNYIKDDILSMVFYVLILILSTIFAPIDLAFLMPIASAVWGWFIAGILSLIGWTIGSALVFVLSRRYGVPLIERFTSLEKLHEYEKLMPTQHIFAQIVLLRLVIPLDIVSYTIGLLTEVKFIPFIIATFIGFLPCALILAYLGTLPAFLQIIGFFILVLIILVSLLTANHYARKGEKQCS